MWFEVTAYCEEGPFKLITDDRDEALDWAAAQEKKHCVRPSEVVTHRPVSEYGFWSICWECNEREQEHRLVMSDGRRVCKDCLEKKK